MKEQSNGVKRTGRFHLCLRSVLAMAAICFCTVFLQAQSNGITTKDTKAKEAVDAAHKALGGADKIDGVKSLLLSGTGAISATVPIEFDIRWLSPDNYFRLEKAFETTPYIHTTSRYYSVSNRELTTMMFSDPAGTMNTAPTPRVSKEPDLLNANLGFIARLLIGTLMKAGPMPLTISSSSIPDRFVITTPVGVLCEIEFDAQSKYPSSLRYKQWVVASITPGGPWVPPTPNYEEQETVMRFSEWMAVDGIMIPRVVTYKADTVDRVMRIEKIQINPNLTSKDFEIPKQ